MRRLLMAAGLVVAVALPASSGFTQAQAPETPARATAVPRAPTDPRDPRNAPPAQFNPVDPAGRARADARVRDVRPRPGETITDAHRRAGIIPLCDQTRGKAVRNHHGVTMQLDPDECMVGDSYAIVEGKPLLTLRKGDAHHGTVRPNGEKLLVDLTRVRGKAQN